ncbi:MAG: hypothetical protein ACRELB_14650 [Polyangiaceae bacterium]
MTPEQHVRLLVSLAEVTDHVFLVSDEGSGIPRSTPLDADPGASSVAIDGVQTLITSLGGGYTRRTTTEHREPEGDTITRVIVEKTLATLPDGVAGRTFVEQAWPLAEAWLRNKERRTFRVKYGEVICDLRALADVESALELMKDAVAAPRPEPEPARKAKAGARTKPKAGAKAAPKARAAKKPAAKKPAAKAKAKGARGAGAKAAAKTARKARAAPRTKKPAKGAKRAKRPAAAKAPRKAAPARKGKRRR